MPSEPRGGRIQTGDLFVRRKPMSELRNLDPQEYRTAVRVPLLTFLVLIIGAWVFWGVRLIGFDVLGHLSSNRSSNEPISQLTYLAVAGAVTVFGLPMMWWQIRSNLRLLHVGMRTEARFVSRGVVQKNGIVPVTFGYTVNGVEYTKRRDVDASHADAYDEQTRIRIIVDPKKPSRCILSPYDVVAGGGMTKPK
ncbi:MAG: hypothetical protein JWM97_716 [Phycisphaerales bacterium]|jgi:hypothetical protein|nr:hypothetical protein [Phycisphaerales bacterium]